MTDQQLLRKLQELAVHLVEVAIDPNHPVSRMNGARWKQEARHLMALARRRGLIED